MDRERKQSHLSSAGCSDAVVMRGPDSRDLGQLKVLLANVRGLRQGAAELRKRVNQFRPHLIGLVETHLLKDPLSGLLPQGYRPVHRLDRSKHGGGLLWLARSHILVDKVNMAPYNIVEAAEVLGIKCMGETFQLCYTPKSALAPRLINACENYMLDHPVEKVNFFGDFNVHNPGWICSTSDADTGGMMAENMCQMFGLNQLIDFPTRDSNTLDLVMTQHSGSAISRAGLGTTDHVSIDITLDLCSTIPQSPAHKPTLLWKHAAWDHIRGAVKKQLKDWDPSSLSVDEAVESLDKILCGIIQTFVKLSKPKKPGPVVWWNASCQAAYTAKIQLFPKRFEDSVNYNAVVNHCRTVQNRAFAVYQKQLRVQLNDMDKSQKKFWQFAKEIGGVDVQRSGAAPPAEALAEHFATKMSNGAGQEDHDFVPQDAHKMPLHSWKIRRKRVKQVLHKIDPSKSANGISPRFWKEVASVVNVAVTKLFQRIVRLATWPTIWKNARVTPPHKRGSVMLASNYRPLSVLVNLSVYMEDCIEPQFDVWMRHFTPDCQFGFVKGTGTDDYGAALTMTMLVQLDNRGEGILVSLDVKGAFDRVWWSRLKARLQAKGMTGKALKLLRDYLWRRFIQVVHGGDASELKEIFSGVPQGAKLSPKLWNFDISEMEHYLSFLCMLICYADDCGLWYAITAANRHHIVDTINTDLASLLQWGEDNRTTFEPSKTHFTLISNRTSSCFDLCFPFPRIVFDGALVKRKPAVKLVGYLFDEHLSWAGMIKDVAMKARRRLGMLVRLRPLLDDQNMQRMYTAFIRPVMEYGSLQYMGAAPTHLALLDRIQHTAEKIGRFTVESLQSRREAAAVVFTLKLLAGGGRGVLNDFVPELIDHSKIKRSRDSRHASTGLQLISRCKVNSLDAFKRSYIGSIHQIWARLPQDLIRRGEAKGWMKIRKACKAFLLNESRDLRAPDLSKKQKTVMKDETVYEKGMKGINLRLTHNKSKI